MLIHDSRARVIAIVVLALAGCTLGGGAEFSGSQDNDSQDDDRPTDKPGGGGGGGQMPGTGLPDAGAPDAGAPDAATPTATCANDELGIRQIYCTKLGGDDWFINMVNPGINPARFNPKTTITQNLDGSWKATAASVRMNAFTVEGYKPSSITTYNQAQLAVKGYMQSAMDWKNVEMTAYLKVNNPGAGDDNIGFWARGGLHGSAAGDDGTGCEGTAYKANLHYSGATSIAKKHWHPSGYTFTPTKPAQAGSIVGKWVGIKTIIFDTPDGVQVELWADWAANNTWVRVDDFLDSTGFGTQGTHCMGAADGRVGWGGPVATFSWDTATDVDFRNLSVREIDPTLGGGVIQ
ncbi:MAG: carbohydrate-binding protein [Kofleriaceae bacterium]